MFSVEVRDRIMIGHSLPDPFFGPAQAMHGATFVVDVAFFREELNRQNVVVDIGAALDVLSKTLKPLNYQNLDVLPQFGYGAIGGWIALLAYVVLLGGALYLRWRSGRWREIRL